MDHFDPKLLSLSLSIPLSVSPSLRTQKVHCYLSLSLSTASPLFSQSIQKYHTPLLCWHGPVSGVCFFSHHHHHHLLLLLLLCCLHKLLLKPPTLLSVSVAFVTLYTSVSFSPLFYIFVTHKKNTHEWTLGAPHMERGSSSLTVSSSSANSSESLNGLKFGQKIYFEDLGVGAPAKSGTGSSSSSSAAGSGGRPPPAPPKKVRGSGVVQGGQPPRCQVEGCKVDLSDAKAYYSRHKVCGMHSKSPTVIVAGLEQRFCQQCSRSAWFLFSFSRSCFFFPLFFFQLFALFFSVISYLYFKFVDGVCLMSLVVENCCFSVGHIPF